MARQGWESATTLIQLLCKSWVQTDLGEVDLQEWVMENAERVEVAREKAIANKTDTADKRKQEWDAKAKNREFAVGEEVLVRKPNMNLKLADSWEGPFIVYKKISPLSYAIDIGDRIIPSVHQLMKQYQHDSDNPKINRVTSVFESDTKQDDTLDRYSEETVQEQELQTNQARDIQSIVDKFQDVLTKEPGLTTLTEFGIETGETQSIFQRAYNPQLPLTRASTMRLTDCY